MPTTADYLEQLEQDREDLVDNLETQGITGLTGNETFTELVPEVLNISGGGDPSDYFVLSMYNSNNPKITGQLKKLPAITLDNTNTTVTSLQDFFYGCFSLEEVDVSNFTKTGLTILSRMFGYCQELETIKGFENMNTSSVTKFDYLFSNCNKLKNVNLSNINTSSATTFESMFSNCQSIESIITNGIVGSSATTFTSMFANCYSLKTISLPNLNPTGANGFYGFCQYDNELENVSFPVLGTCSSVTTLRYMFRGCTKLKNVIMPMFNITSTINATNSQYIFGGCSNLEKIDWRSFDWSKITPGSNTFQSVPDNCLIIVADDTQKAWFNNGTYTSRFTNVKTVAEL